MRFEFRVRHVTRLFTTKSRCRCFRVSVAQSAAGERTQTWRVIVLNRISLETSVSVESKQHGPPVFFPNVDVGMWRGRLAGLIS